MVAKPVPGAGPSNEAAAESKLQEALARVKVATDRQAAVIDVLSRISVSPLERRAAQAQSKKVERDLRDARQQLEAVQASTSK